MADAVWTLMNFSENSKTLDNNTNNALSAIKRNLWDIKVKLMKQFPIINLLSNKQDNN
jgi:hypothetical protein